MRAKGKKKRAQRALKNPKITIITSERVLTLYDGNQALYRYPVAIGKPSTPTIVGNYKILTKIVNPGGILGTRWMGLNYDAYGIHGTSRPWQIGQMVSLGCVRMHNRDVEQVFSLVHLGTPVYIRDEVSQLFRDEISAGAALDEEIL